VLWRLAQSTFAAGLAWELARQVPGHTQPFFAPISALIALNAPPGLRGRQAIQVVAGVTLGIGIGALVVTTLGRGSPQIVLVVALALVLCTAAGANPLVTTQAAASAILVIALHRPGQNLAAQRLVDALIGGGIAIVLARFLFPIDPLALVRRESERLRGDLADAFDELAPALRERDAARATAALDRVDAVDDRRLNEALALAREVARKAPRRRPVRRRLDALEGLGSSLAAASGDARALVTGALRTIETVEEPNTDAADAVEALAAGLRTRDGDAVRAAAGRAREAARAAVERDGSLGMGVVAHAIASIADDLEGSARARDSAQRVSG
jgi:uncharacterized membrane protein YgaE (UPF0421/DUF939 family)